MTSGMPPLDLAHVREFGGGDLLAEREFVRVFLDESDKSLAALQDHRTDGKNQSWSETMHYLKNSFGLIGAENLRLLCEKGQQQQDVPAAERAALFDDIMAAYDSVRFFLKQLYAI